MTRRRFAPRLLPLLALMLLLSTQGASAARGWCLADPHISVGGRTSNITVGYDASYANTTTGPIQLIVTVPKGKTVQILQQDPGFGYGWQITVQVSSKLPVTPGPTSVQLSVYVPAATALPIQIVSDPDCSPCPTTTRTTTANTWITFITQF
jgi:hypothetical protein